MRQFSIGASGRSFDFSVNRDGWVEAVTRADGTTPVIGGQLDLDAKVAVPEDWTEEHEATGFNPQIAAGDDFYPDAGFDQTLITGQLDDVLWALPGAANAPSGRLLEVGCGPGFLLQALSRSLQGWEVVGVDPARESVRQARARGLEVKHGFVESVDLQGQFDAIVIMGNFQLHTDPLQTLRSLAGIASPEAELFLDLKNPRSTARLAARALVTTPVIKKSSRVNAFAAHAWHGLRHGIPRPAMAELLERSGWETREIRTVAPRLLRFENTHGFGAGRRRRAWQVLDAVDRRFNERAWIQVSATRG